MIVPSWNFKNKKSTKCDDYGICHSIIRRLGDDQNLVFEVQWPKAWSRTARMHDPTLYSRCCWTIYEQGTYVFSVAISGSQKRSSKLRVPVGRGGGGGGARYHAWAWSCDDRPSHLYNAETEHVGFSPTKQTFPAPSARRHEVMGDSHEG